MYEKLHQPWLSRITGQLLAAYNALESADVPAVAHRDSTHRLSRYHYCGRMVLHASDLAGRIARRGFPRVATVLCAGGAATRVRCRALWVGDVSVDEVKGSERGNS